MTHNVFAFGFLTFCDVRFQVSQGSTFKYKSMQNPHVVKSDSSANSQINITVHQNHQLNSHGAELQ